MVGVGQASGYDLRSEESIGLDALMSSWVAAAAKRALSTEAKDDDPQTRSCVPAIHWDHTMGSR